MESLNILVAIVGTSLLCIAYIAHTLEDARLRLPLLQEVVVPAQTQLGSPTRLPIFIRSLTPLPHSTIVCTEIACSKRSLIMRIAFLIDVEYDFPTQTKELMQHFLLIPASMASSCNNADSTAFACAAKRACEQAVIETRARLGDKKQDTQNGYVAKVIHFQILP